ncbi:thrombospondin type 3 repeat-containing protein, partial [Flavobacteriaceae bacterium]|nr:thrombospondin type 3 repeat-containing protein [Flavobacteriaceae bacterium]
MKRILYLFILLGFNLVYAQTETFVISPSGQVSNTVIDNIGQTVTTSALSGGLTLSEGFLYNFDFTTPTVILTDTDSNNLVSNSDVVTITATFSESMAATPTLSLSGITTGALMTASASSSIWTYTWTVSTTVTSTTATVSGTDLSGNAYAGTDSLTFSIDNLGPTVVLSNNSLNNRVSNTQSVTLYATFSEELDITPTISLSGITTDAAMSNGNTIVLKPNNGWTSSSGSFQDFNGSSGSHPYLAEDLVIFSYLDNASIYKNFTISSGTVSVVVKLDYKKSYSEDTGQVKLYYYDANSTLLSTDASAVLTGTSDFQNLNFQSSVPSGAVVVRLELIQINESEFWAGNYGIRYRDLEITGVDEGTVYGGNDTWSYTWTVSTTATSTTATVSATDNAGNSYTGSESMTFVIDNERPYAVSTTLSNNLKAGYISATDTNTLTITFNEEINASTFTASDVTILPSGYFSISEHTSSDNTIFIGYLNVLSNYAGVVTLTLNENSLEDFAGNANTVASISFISDYTVPTVTLTDTDSDNLVSNSEVVTLTATFSESMSATPTLSLTGIVSDAEMTATASDSIWTYTWTVSGSTVTSTTATVSGTDLAGNAYSGTDSITFTIDNSNPTLVSFTDSDTDNYVNDYTNVTLSATFSESMASSPTIKIDNGTNVILVNSASMTVSSSTSSATWTYFWDVPGGSDGTYFATVSGTDLSGNAYTGTESITFVVDNTAPLIQSVTVTNTNSKVLLTYNEPVQLYDPSYFASNFSVTKTGGTATVSYTGYSFSTTDSNTVILNIIVTGEPTGDELLEVGPVGASTLIDKAGNYAMDYSDSNQTSNTVYLTNTPPKFASTSVSSNNTSITIAFSEGVTADTSGTELSKTDFTLAVSGGAAVLASATPIALSKTDSKTYVLTTSYSVPSNGSEILTVTPISSAVFDSKGTQINLSSAQSNTVQLNDQAGPFITGATLDSQNRYVDFTFSEGVYATASPTSAVTSSSFTLSQSSGPSYGMTISSITTAGGGVLSGGETTLRFNLESAVKPTGQEVFAITATDSSSVVDASGNSMTVSQTNNTFQLKPPTSGGVSPKKSTISAAPAQMIGNGINTAVITVQAKDSLGQNFLEGGYQITLFGPNGDLTTTDNQNGTYSASYTPEAITQDFQELTFGFRVADTNGTPTALLQLYLDEDGDGVYNINDACLGTEAGLEVDATGCALNQLDSDNDGVFDDLDECPDTPEQELNNVQGTPTYGELIPTVVDEKGCGASQRDTDSDGIVDTEDNCIETANADQADTDGDGIGDVCDTDNPLPEITTTEIKFVQLPQNGTTVGKIEATDPDGETLTFTQSGDNFTGVLSIASDGSITVSSGALLTFDSTYNGASLGFTVSDGKNDVHGSVKILIEDVPRPPEISIITLEISEDAEVGTIVGFVEAKDPMGGQIVSISLQGDGFIELKDGVLKT